MINPRMNYTCSAIVKMSMVKCVHSKMRMDWTNDFTKGSSFDLFKTSPVLFNQIMCRLEIRRKFIDNEMIQKQT